MCEVAVLRLAGRHPALRLGGRSPARSPRLLGTGAPRRAHPAFQAPAHRGALALLRRALTRPSAGLAAYSNRAGSHAERFIVADGRSFQGTDGSFAEGTSFAAPQVSGYAAFLRQKFPNLIAPQTASIILDTAQWQSAWGEKNGANQAVYGQGEARMRPVSLTRWRRWGRCDEAVASSAATEVSVCSDLERHSMS